MALRARTREPGLSRAPRPPCKVRATALSKPKGQLTGLPITHKRGLDRAKGVSQFAWPKMPRGCLAGPRQLIQKIADFAVHANKQQAGPRQCRLWPHDTLENRSAKLFGQTSKAYESHPGLKPVYRGGKPFPNKMSPVR